MRVHLAQVTQCVAQVRAVVVQVVRDAVRHVALQRVAVEGVVSGHHAGLEGVVGRADNPDAQQGAVLSGQRNMGAKKRVIGAAHGRGGGKVVPHVALRLDLYPRASYALRSRSAGSVLTTRHMAV